MENHGNIRLPQARPTLRYSYSQILTLLSETLPPLPNFRAGGVAWAGGICKTPFLAHISIKTK